ncbi:MAG TPA: translation initiation factor [bacterium]|nr:translation initiation factor [bacterium]
MGPIEHKLVWSSHPKPEAPQAEEPRGLPPKGQRINVRRELQGRAGKTVTALWGFQSSERQLEELAKALKKGLGTGGSAKEGRVEIQGDKVAAVLAWLEKQGYKPVKAGG